jgi:putative ABC transport system permease protein
MPSMLLEIRQAARRLLASPGYSGAAFVTLTLGLALSVGMYTVLNGVILNALPYPGGERMVEIRSVNARQNETDGGLTVAEVFALADAAAFEQAGWYRWYSWPVLHGETPREILGAYVSAGFFAALGVPAQAGRWIDAGDTRTSSEAVVLSDQEWQRLTNRDPEIVGKTLALADATVTVVGVMPPAFAYPSRDVGMWRAEEVASLTRDPEIFGNTRYLHAVGRLAAGVEGARASLSLDALSAELRDTHGLSGEGWRLRTTSLLEAAVGDVRGVLAGVFVVSLVVLAIACANVGSLLAARLATRERELAVVQALGATAARVWRGVLFELLLLAVLATAAALLLLIFGLDAFRSLAADTLPRADEISFDPVVAAFAAALALLCPLLVAAPFALRLRRRMGANLNAGKGQGSAPSAPLRVLPVAGLALATCALIAGTAVALSLDRLQSVDPGIRTDDVYGVQVYHHGGPDEWRRFPREVLARLAAEPDVTGVAMTTMPPLADVGRFMIDVQVPARDRAEPLRATLQRVSPGYFEVVGQPLQRGRGLLDSDDANAAKVAIVNETFARRVFGGADAVGRYVGLPQDLPRGDAPHVNYRIVGVAADMRNAGLKSAPAPEIFVPFMQSPWVGRTFLVRAPRAGTGLLERMQEAIWAVDPEQPISRASSLRDDLNAHFAQAIFFARMLGGFAVLALLLAAFGTYSVIAFVQRRQITETGVRLALGAAPVLVARHVLSQGVKLAAVAGVAGSVAAILVLRLLAGQLFGVGAASPVLYAAGVGGVLLAALLASIGPAIRALRVNPMEALRHE